MGFILLGSFYCPKPIAKGKDVVRVGEFMSEKNCKHLGLIGLVASGAKRVKL